MATPTLGLSKGGLEELPAAVLPDPSTGSSFVSYSEMPQAAPQKSLLLPVVFMVFALTAAGVAGVFFLKKSPLASSSSAPEFEDLGAGISKSTGLRGALKVRWQNGGEYQVHFEPIDPLQSAGFSYFAANPPAATSITMRILDTTGFTLCTRKIVFSTSGGKGDFDAFQNTVSSEGKVTEFNAQGKLPCTADQFRQASYWDFTTNFPSLTEQAAIMKTKAAERARREAAAAQSSERSSGFGFVAEGSDAIADYDSGHGVLETRLGRNFVVRAADRSTASNWATARSLFHYRCDQQGRCSLTRSGGGAPMNVMAMQ